MGETGKVVDICLLTVGTTTGFANIENILGIIILAIQLVWLVTKLIVKIINTVKNKKSLETLDDDVGSVINHLEIFKDNQKLDEVDIENGHNDKE